MNDLKNHFLTHWIAFALCVLFTLSNEGQETTNGKKKPTTNQKLQEPKILNIHQNPSGEEAEVLVHLQKQDTSFATQQAIKQVTVHLAKHFTSSMPSKEQEITKRIFELSDRYILYTKTHPFKKTDSDTFTVSVTVGFSQNNLKKILVKEGLFYTSKAHLKILPLVLFKNNLNNTSYSWWVKGNTGEGFSPSVFKIFYDHVQNHMLSRGFYVLNPEFAQLREFTHKSLWFKKPKKKNVFRLARFFNADLVLTGTVQIKSTGINSIVNLNMDFSVYHSQTGRKLAESKKWQAITLSHPPPVDLFSESLTTFFKTQADFTSSLGDTLKSLYESGHISSYVFLMKVKGKLSYQNSQKLTTLLLSHLPLTHINEHILSSKSVTYRAYSHHPMDEVVKQLNRLHLKDWHIRNIHTKNKTLIFTPLLK